MLKRFNKAPAAGEATMMRWMKEEATQSTPPASCTAVIGRANRESDLLARARGEYLEMPGLRLTLEQAMRLWNLDRTTCQSLLTCLVESRFLEIDGHGMYHMAHPGY